MDTRDECTRAARRHWWRLERERDARRRCGPRGNGVGAAPVGQRGGVAGPLPVRFGQPAMAPAPGLAANPTPPPFVQQLPAFNQDSPIRRWQLGPFTEEDFGARHVPQLPPPPPTAQLNDWPALPHRRGNFAPVGGPVVRRSLTVANDTLRLDLCELFQSFPTPHRRRGFTRDMLLAELLT